MTHFGRVWDESDGALENVPDFDSRTGILPVKKQTGNLCDFYSHRVNTSLLVPDPEPVEGLCRYL
jgi:hypothetical protein